MQLFPIAKTILAGHSYWRVVLTSGKEVSEIGTKVDFALDPQTGRPLARRRKIEWLEDIVGSGDSAHIKELHLVTSQGDACLPIEEPYTAFQLHRGFAALFTNERILLAQIIGRVDNKETGECTACIWDAQEQKLYVDHHTSVFDFKRWRPGVADVGALSLDVVGVRL